MPDKVKDATVPKENVLLRETRNVKVVGGMGNKASEMSTPSIPFDNTGHDATFRNRYIVKVPKL